MRAGRVRLVAALLLVTGMPAVAGDIYACKGPGGVTSYQNLPCEKASDQLGHGTYDSALGQPSWQQVSSSFIAAHPDINWGSNDQVMQLAINRVVQGNPAISNQDLLVQAYVIARASPAWATPASVPITPVVAYQPPAPLPAPVAIPPLPSVASTPEPAEQPLNQWQSNTVEGVPGAVMTAPNEALNPYNGHIFQLEPALPGINIPRRPLQGGSAEADAECDQARRAGMDAEAAGNCAMGLSPDGQP